MSRALPSLLLLLLGALGAGGCATAGFAAVGPVFSVIQAIGDRSVERTLSADLPTAEAATVDVLRRMEVRVREADRSGERWALEGAGESLTVRAELARVTPRMTRVALRVEAGGLLADKQTATEILNQVALRLAGPAATAKGEPPSAERSQQAEALSAIEREIRRFRSELEEARLARGPAREPATPAEPVVAVARGVLVIPPSYGVPTLPAAHPGPPAPEAIRAAFADEGPRLPAGVGLMNGAVAEERLATPLLPVGALAPIPGLAGGRAERRSSEQ